MEGELTFACHDHFSCGPLALQVLQMPKLGGKRA